MRREKWILERKQCKAFWRRINLKETWDFHTERWAGWGRRDGGQSQGQFVWQKAQKPAKAQTWEQSYLNSQPDVLNKHLTARADPSKVSESMRNPIRAVVRMNESGRQNRLNVGKPPRMFLQSSGWEEMRMGNRRVALRMGKKGPMWETLWHPLVNGTRPPTPWAFLRHDSLQHCQVVDASSIEHWLHQSQR